MAVLSNAHLFDQVEKLIVPPPAGPPRQVDVRRAISAAYYGVFHHVLTKAADEFVGVVNRATRNYAVVYRSISHTALSKMCQDIQKSTLPSKLAKVAPIDGFGTDIVAFAEFFPELQDKRHSADYDPFIRVKTADAKLALSSARSAVSHFDRAEPTQRKAFLTILVFQYGASRSN